jgi:hypothetical protein
MTQRDSASSPSGEIAHIYDEIQALYGVAYVSAIHHQLADWPGFLEWAWAAVAPVFRSGAAQRAARRCAEATTLTPLEPIPSVALRAWDIDRPALASLRAATDGFVRVAPINMVFAGLVKALLQGATPGGAAPSDRGQDLPAALPSPPDMIDLARTDSVRRDLALTFASDLAGKPFVPGLYRMIIHWPGLAAHLATVLRPRMVGNEAVAAYDALRAAIDTAVPELLMTLPVVETPYAMPSATERSRFLEVGQTYRKTSPELVVAGRLLGGALPKDV